MRSLHYGRDDIVLLFYIVTFMVEVLGGEEAELDLVGGFLDGKASDVGV